MKKAFCGISVLLVCLICSGSVMAEEITIVGTGSGMALLQTVGNEFAKTHPDVKIIVPESIGSSGGIKAVGTDQALVGRIGRKLKDTEAHYGLSYIPFVRLPIVFFVNKSVGIKDITPQQACGIYSGKITNWKEVGGKDARIKVVRREDGDSSLQVLQESLPGFKDIAITDKSKTTLRDQETLEFVASKEDTIAFGTYGDAKVNQVDVLTLGGKKPDEADYPYTGSLALIVKEKNYTGNIRAFADFVTSSDAHAIIREAGGLPFLK
ncbi:MAG: substrate-binding domain-containing protein [Desulfococcaceae bacterium]